MEIKNVKMYDRKISGISIASDSMVFVIGEQVAKLEDGREVEQYLYDIVGYIPENGQPFVSLKANIVLLGVE